MLLESAPTTAHMPITQDEAKAALSTGRWSDEAALKIVLADCVRAENYANTKTWISFANTASQYYQSPPTARYWDGNGGLARSSLPSFTVASCVNALVPQIINGLFYENPPFIVQPRPKTSENTARAITSVLGFQLEDINFREELRLGTHNAVLYGTAIWKWGWDIFTREEVLYSRKNKTLELPNPLGGDAVQISDDEELEEEVIEEYVDRPFFEHIVNLKHVLVDPGTNVPDIRKAKYVIHRLFPTWDDLDKLRERPGYNIPSREKLLELFFPPKEPVEAAVSEVSVRSPLSDLRAEPRYEETTEDPFEKPLEMLERWDGRKLIVVLQKKLTICNTDNPYGETPFLSVNWWDVSESFLGMGLAKTIGAEQRFQQGIRNAVTDETDLNLNGVYVRVLGKSVPTQNIRIAPGKIINVEEKDGFKPLDRLPAVPEAFQLLSLSQQIAEQISGVPGLSQGMAGSGGHSNIARSSAGAQLIGQGASAQPSEFVEKLANQVIVPFLYAVHKMDRMMLPAATWKYILTDELQHAYADNFDIIELRNSKVKFQILAGAKMQVRRNIAQLTPILIQFLTSPEIVQGLGVEKKKVNANEVIHMMMDSSGAGSEYYSVISEMSQEDEQRWQMTTPAAQQQAKAQGQAALMNQQFEQKKALLDQESVSRAGRDVLRHAYESAVTPQALTGQPGGGFE